MAVLSGLKIDILSNFGSGYVAIAEVEFYNAGGTKLSNSGITASASSTYSDYYPQKMLDGVIGAAANIWNSSSALPVNKQFAVFSFATPTDVAQIKIFNREGEYQQSTKDITIVAFDANYENTYTLSATRPSDAANESTTHNLADAVYASFVKRGILAKFPRLAPAANYGAPGARAIHITVARKDQVDGGAYRLTGVVTSNGSPARRRVGLFDQLSLMLIRETWSDSITGVYVFENIRQGTFFVLAHDHTGAFDPEAKADLVAEAM